MIPLGIKIRNAEILIARCIAIIHKDRALARTGTYDIRLSGQSQHCSADAQARAIRQVRSFHVGAICGGDSGVCNCVAGMAPWAAVDVDVLEVWPQGAFFWILYQCITALWQKKGPA